MKLSWCKAYILIIGNQVKNCCVAIVITKSANKMFRQIAKVPSLQSPIIIISKMLKDPMWQNESCWHFGIQRRWNKLIDIGNDINTRIDVRKFNYFPSLWGRSTPFLMSSESSYCSLVIGWTIVGVEIRILTITP